MPCGILCRAGYHAVRDTVPCGIPCRAGYRAVRDTVPCGIPCRAGYHAARDTMPRGIPCNASSSSARPRDGRSCRKESIAACEPHVAPGGSVELAATGTVLLVGMLGVDSDARMCRCAQPCTTGYSRVLEERLEEILDGTRGYSKRYSRAPLRSILGFPRLDRGACRTHTGTSPTHATHALEQQRQASKAGGRAESCRAVRDTVPYRGLPTYRAAWDTGAPPIIEG